MRLVKLYSVSKIYVCGKFGGWFAQWKCPTGVLHAKWLVSMADKARMVPYVRDIPKCKKGQHG